MKLCLAACFAFCALPGLAIALDLPTAAKPISERISEQDAYAMPVGSFDGANVPAIEITGNVARRSWRIDGASSTTRQLMTPLRGQLERDGYEILFECETRACGGFDFRFGTEVIPTPDMYVDLGDFRFLSTARDRSDAVSVLISRGRSSAFVQIIQVTPDGRKVEPVSTTAATPVDGGSLVGRLQAQGYVVLEDLEFETGANKLGPGPYGSLHELVAFLAENPEFRIVFVGHTDSVGSLDANVKLSRARAAAVRDYMVKTLNVPAGQVGADGMGYLSPIESNLTKAGREANRRVEAILLPK